MVSSTGTQKASNPKNHHKVYFGVFIGVIILVGIIAAVLVFVESRSGNGANLKGKIKIATNPTPGCALEVNGAPSDGDTSKCPK